jgi:ribosomal protein L37E
MWKRKMDKWESLPSRGKVTSDGEQTKPHHSACRGRCYVHYEENGLYRVECEKCGTLVTFRTRSMDWAIKIWNDMPDAIGG